MQDRYRIHMRMMDGGETLLNYDAIGATLRQIREEIEAAQSFNRVEEVTVSLIANNAENVFHRWERPTEQDQELEDDVA